MQQTPVTQDRYLFNDAIEDALINTSASVANLLAYLQVPKGDLIDRIYQRFYADFAMLFTLTSDLENIKDKGEILKQINMWLDLQQTDKEDEIMTRCKQGIVLFKEYKKILHGQGLVSLPKKR